MSEKSETWLDRPLTAYNRWLTIENLLAVIIILLALFSRLYGVGWRSMSHDEVNHVVPAFDLYEGRGYRHDPITHGPFQFHLLALSYTLFGDNDFSARIPAALFSTAAVGYVLFGFRRYLGRKGALFAGFFFLISPYMLFYGRYTRNEGLIELLGVMMLFAVLRYLDNGKPSSLYILTTALVLHFCTKETSFIYAAQLLLFLALLFLARMAQVRWPDNRRRHLFIILMAVTLSLVVIGIGLGAYEATLKKQLTVDTTISPQLVQFILTATLTCVGLAILSGGVAVVTMIRALGWRVVRAERSFDLLVLVGTLVLPQLTAFPIKFIGTLIGQDWNPLDYTTQAGAIRFIVSLSVLLIASSVAGLLWNAPLWMGNAILFYAVYAVFYTTFFTNGLGFVSGIVGSLGYWLSQQGEQRGTQPWYYYAFLQIPMYEYLAALGTLLAVYLGFRHQHLTAVPGDSPAAEPQQFKPRQNGLNQTELRETEPQHTEPQHTELQHTELQQIESIPESNQSEAVEPAVLLAPAPQPLRIPTLALLLFWALTSLIAYSVAGEKMPWLTVHITLPMLLAAGWSVGWLADKVSWDALRNKEGVASVAMIGAFFIGIASLLGSLLGLNPPFQKPVLGGTLTADQISATYEFIFWSIVTVFSAWGVFSLLRKWRVVEVLRLATLILFVFLSGLTVRHAYRASFINYDNAREFLVYAHAAGDFKDVVEQVEEISRRTTGGLDAVVAYDNDVLYGGWWYFRHYPNKRWFTDPTRDLETADMIVVSEANFSRLEPIVKDQFIGFDYMRLWWPMQDYYGLTWQKIGNALKSPQLRTALYQIWLNRDYDLYAEATNNDHLTLENWQPSARMRLYIRRDIAARIWDYGVAAAAAPEPAVDPYLEKIQVLTPDIVIGVGGNPVQLTNPHGIALASDGSIYVADSRAHRILHFSPDGQTLINSWGQFAAAANNVQPEGGYFNEPWGVAVGPDGSVYVTDTWNYRIQKFTADGEFVTAWGTMDLTQGGPVFYGPRGIAVDREGRVYVTDTGNKRVVVFTAEGQFLAEFGTGGMALGELDEPVGIAVSVDGRVFVADTWNRRVQVFMPNETRTLFTPMATFDISGWKGQDVENKPFLAINQEGHIFVTDPPNYRVLEFTDTGEFIGGWGGYSTLSDGFGNPSAIVVDLQGRAWVTDSANNLILRFTLP